MDGEPLPIEQIFSACANALAEGEGLERLPGEKGDYDGEGWLARRLDECRFSYQWGGRRFPDFRLAEASLGIEVKSAAFPDRKDFDANSHLPAGTDEGGDIYYLFLRYSKGDGQGRSPLVDLVLCHGDLFNVDGSYVHLNGSIDGFGSHGDIKMRLRNMYRPPSPYQLLEGLDQGATLITPADTLVTSLSPAGTLKRQGAPELIKDVLVDYESNKFRVRKRPNPNAGSDHHFCAWRTHTLGPTVSLRMSGEAL